MNQQLARIEGEPSSKIVTGLQLKHSWFCVHCVWHRLARPPRETPLTLKPMMLSVSCKCYDVIRRQHQVGRLVNITFQDWKRVSKTKSVTSTYRLGYFKRQDYRRADRQTNVLTYVRDSSNVSHQASGRPPVTVCHCPQSLA